MIRLSGMLKFANFINLKISLNSFNPEYLELKDNKSHIKMKLNYIIVKELSLRLSNIMYLFEINNNFLSKDKDYISSTIFNFWQNTQSDKLLIGELPRPEGRGFYLNFHLNRNFMRDIIHHNISQMAVPAFTFTKNFSFLKNGASFGFRLI